MASTSSPVPPLAPSSHLPLAPESIGFADLIAPVDTATFLRDYWEQQPLATRGRAAEFFAPLFSLDDVDHCICYYKPRPGRIDLVSPEGFVRDNFVNLDQTANINLVYESYLKGSTIVLSGLEETWEPLVRFSRVLERELSHPIAVAVYVTPPSTRGVQPHFDTQENFLLQVEGVKHWKVYPAARELPPVEGSYMPVPRESLPAPILETTLHPGDVLYIPRGFVHEASSGDQPSLHITVDVHVKTWFDLLSDALAWLADKDASLRRSLPLGFLSQPEPPAAMREQLATYLQRLQGEVRLEDALRKRVEHLVVKKPPPPDGHFTRLHAAVEADTRLRKRETTLVRQFRDGDHVGIQFSGNQLVGPAKIAEALAFIAETRDSFTPAMLPGRLSDREKLVLARRLVRIGLLAMVAPLSRDEGKDAPR